MESLILGFQRLFQCHLGWGVWRSIRALWDSMEEELTLKVGNDIKVKFWKMFGSVKALGEVFPDLYSICNNPEAKISDCWTAQGWDLSFRRFLND
ncbi:hypothetical protein MTR67_019092 [Solanum verrucosum]|uniref:Uncharacterized protein n=1 Tax=Solanum verrucosum TaxID=315347 RepID=A0AAF0QKW5_SOLVR|nr:hypothetical protein MTR67_019092 [Solanum verrucosum]